MTREEALQTIYDHCQHCDETEKALEILKENKGEWIPVSERLPEKNTKVYLACCDDGYVTSIMYDSGKWLINDTNIIAWMPLPEPYKADMRGE